MARVGVVVRGVLLLGLLAAPARSQSRSDAERFAISVHARSTRATARAEQAAWLSLTLPLGGLAARRPVLRSAATIPKSDAGSSETSAVEPAPSTAQAGQDDMAGEPPITFEQLRTLSELSRRATAVALAVAGAAVDRRRLDALSTRARWSAVLPELRLRAQRNTDQALRWAPTSDDPYRVTQADGAGTTLEASATFRLDRLLFSREELVVERLRAQAGQERLELERRVLGAVVGLFRARELGCAAGVDEDARVQQRVRGVELFAELDVLTAGWFAEQAPELGRAVWGFPEALLGQCRPLAPRSAVAAETKPVASLGDSE
jgi:hypothetical protein